MGPQPPLKRRPTYTPYTLPCKRDISAKLTPAGVGASTHTAHQQKAKLSSSLRIDIYIYIYTHVDTVATNRYLTVTSLDIFRPLPTHFHPVFSVVCPPEFALVFPGYFPTFPPFRYPCFVTLRPIRGSIPFPSWCLREFSTSVRLPSSPILPYARPSNRLREIQFQRYWWLTLLSLSISLTFSRLSMQACR